MHLYVQSFAQVKIPCIIFNIFMYEEKRACWFLEHWQNLVLLVIRFHCFGRLVWRVSAWKVCEWWSENKRRTRRRIHVTMLIFRALARPCAPRGPILLFHRFSSVSVCVKRAWMVKSRKEQEEEEFVLPCSFVEHWQGLVLLAVRFHWIRGLVWWVSVWKMRQWWSEEKKEKKKDSCYLVDF
jgi:hypothetical protein